MVTKKALLVGCNYKGVPGVNELHGCCSDARRMRQALTRYFGFIETRIKVLVDDESGEKPTRVSMINHLNQLISGVRPGDILVFFFSGHGGRKAIPPASGDINDNTGYNEAILPSDGKNPLTDDDFRNIVNKMPAGVKFTFISDSCSSGGLIDELKEQIGDAEDIHRQQQGQQQVPSRDQGQKKILSMDMLINSLNSDGRLHYNVVATNIRTAIYELYREDASPTVRQLGHPAQPQRAARKADDVGILLSGCESFEFSKDNGVDPANPYGEFTKAIETVLSQSERSPTNENMIMAARRVLESKGVPQQHPCLYCSDGNRDKVFICDFVQ